MKRFTFGCALAVALWLGVADAGKPPGGGGTGGGAIYFANRGQLVSMNSDGSGRTALPIGLGAAQWTGGLPEPSYLLHGGQRWFLTTQFVTGTYPDGLQRAEVFAVRGDGLAQVQLTSDPNVKLFGVLRWAKDDVFVSFIGIQWTGPGALDATSHVFRAGVTFDASGAPSLSAAPSAVVDRGVWDHGGRTEPDFQHYFDWSPSGSKVVWVRGRVEPGGLYLEGVQVTDAVAETTTEIASSGSYPNWSPDGAKIAYVGGDGISTIAPDGTGPKLVAKPSGKPTSGSWLERPYWSPTSSHIAYQQQYGTAPHSADVYRVSAGGGPTTNLTPPTNEDPADSAVPIAWR